MPEPSTLSLNDIKCYKNTTFQNKTTGDLFKWVEDKLYKLEFDNWKEVVSLGLTESLSLYEPLYYITNFPEAITKLYDGYIIASVVSGKSFLYDKKFNYFHWKRSTDECWQYYASFYHEELRGEWKVYYAFERQFA